MGLKVRLDARAVADLDAIRDYVAQRNPSAAERIRLRFETLVTALSEFPQIGHATQLSGIRAIAIGAYPYRIYYTIITGTLVILRVRHAARHEPNPSELTG
jgi:toxin ParE1/3/4